MTTGAQQTAVNNAATALTAAQTAATAAQAAYQATVQPLTNAQQAHKQASISAGVQEATWDRTPFYGPTYDAVVAAQATTDAALANYQAAQAALAVAQTNLRAAMAAAGIQLGSREDPTIGSGGVR